MPYPKGPLCDKFDGWVTPADFRFGWTAYAAPSFAKSSCAEGFLLLMAEKKRSGIVHALGIALDDSHREAYEFWLPHIANPKTEIKWHYHKRKEE